MIFHIGDIVQLKAITRNFSAEDGAKAKVIKGNHIWHNKNIITVEWIDDKRNGQCNGNYSVRDFILENSELRIKRVETYGIVAFCKQNYK